MRPIGRDESGAVAVLVSMVVGMGVMLGAAAITIDMGALYAQRRQVQNGADAAAFSLAETCATTNFCMASPTSVAALSTLAGSNGKTTLSGVSNSPSYANGICARNLPASTTSNLPACSTVSGRFTDCPAIASDLAGLAFIEAHTQTLVNGQNLLPPTVAQALGFGGANVEACARVVLGRADIGAQNTLPITMSYCDWKAAVGYVSASDPGTFKNPPVDPWPGYGTIANPWPSPESAISTSKDETSTCATWNGHTAPGGFSWLDQASGLGCSADVIDGWIGGTPGNSYQCSLAPYYGKVVFMPVFDCVAATAVSPIISSTDCTTAAHGGHTYYHIVGYASFYLSGWKFSSETQNSIKPPNGSPSCPGGGAGRCLIGWFTQALTSSLPLAPPTSTNPDFGTRVIKPAG